MEQLRISGGTPLRGRVSVSGSKNAALPVMAASLLSDQPVEITNVPAIEDIETMAAMLRHVGVGVAHTAPNRLLLDPAGLHTVPVGADLTRRLRGSLLLLGGLVGRTGEAAIARPGGDDIGMRRIEQHLEGLRAMGAEVVEDSDRYVARATRLRGARIELDMPTVTGTENLMMAAALADGITVIENAAREPHVVDLARCLAGMGLRLSGAGTETIIVEGTGGVPLHGTTHSVTTDYIEAGTWMVAAAATRGDVLVDRMRPADVRWLIRKLAGAGCRVDEGAGHVRVRSTGALRPVDVTTWPHPGFATDLQSPYVALMTQAHGRTVVSEAVYENRFRHVGELRKLGARIALDGRSAVIDGPVDLVGAGVRVPDIRSGAALVVAGLCARGTTTLDDVFHLDRGYEALDAKLRMLGADAERIEGTPGDLTAVRDFSGVVGD
ncbi:MAG TPA: UDP-N-acetylglucosamine 1-carboxyvinyltransferase [Candidatus Dormibacteraeota bacterium]|nr:UDP-N-acetylglucosamine 1-carboxyvinyltransferase [Candidatus Dormibacteraeota bacterium]